MVKIIQTQIPRRTNYKRQQKILKDWSAIIVEKHSSNTKIPIFSADQLLKEDKMIFYKQRDIKKSSSKSHIK